MLHGITERKAGIVSGVPEDGFREVDVPRLGKNLRVRVLGDDGRPAIVLQHGIQSHAGVWERIARPLANQGYQVLMPDRRGHGLSDHFESYHLLDYVADLNHIVGYFNCSAVTLVGHCESSMITTLLAGARPEKFRNLVNIQFPIPPRVPMNEASKAGLLTTFLKKSAVPYAHPPMKDIEDAAERSIAGAPFPMPKDVALHVAQRNTRNGNDGLVWCWDPDILNYRLLYNTFDMSIVGTLMEKLEIPVSFIYGKSSSLMKTDKDRHLQVTRALKPDGRQILVPGGHYPHLEADYQTLVNVLLDVLSEKQ